MGLEVANKSPPQYGVLVFREAALDDARHVAFAGQFGELDDVKPYLVLGRKNRFDYDELFDVSNINDDGSLVQVDSQRDHVSRVSFASVPFDGCFPPLIHRQFHSNSSPITRSSQNRP